MVTLLIKLKIIKFIELLVMLFLIACTSNQDYKYLIDNKSHLNTTTLKKLTIPEGISLPIQNTEYDIPVGNQNGAIGELLDIRPPIVQTISIFSDAPYAKNSLSVSQLFLSNSIENSSLWLQINIVLQQKAIKIIQKNDYNYFLITDWITWPGEDKNISLQTRQKIQLDQQNTQIAIIVSNEGIKHSEDRITDTIKIQHCNTLMLKMLINSINKMRNTKISEISFDTPEHLCYY